MFFKLYPRTTNRKNTKHIVIYFKDVEKCFNMRIDNACKKLGISKTTLKKICRYFNILKWPYTRKMNAYKVKQSIKSAIPIKDLEQYNDLSFLTGYKITDNPYTLEQILFENY